MFSDELRHIDGPSDAHPNGRAEELFALVVDADGDEFQFARSLLHCLDSLARGTGTDLLQLQSVVAFAFGENSHDITASHCLCSNVERFKIASHLRAVVLSAKRGKHSKRAHQSTEHRRVEQRRFGEKSYGT